MKKTHLYSNFFFPFLFYYVIHAVFIFKPSMSDTKKKMKQKGAINFEWPQQTTMVTHIFLFVTLKFWRQNQTSPTKIDPILQPQKTSDQDNFFPHQS